LSEGRGRAAKKSNASDSAERNTPSTAGRDTKAAKDLDSSRVEGDVESSDVNEYVGDDMATSPPQPVPPPNSAAKSGSRGAMRSAVASVAGKRTAAGAAAGPGAAAGAKATAAATDDDASDVGFSWNYRCRCHFGYANSVCQSFAPSSGKIYGTVMRTISFIQFITLLALLHT